MCTATTEPAQLLPPDALLNLALPLARLGPALGIPTLTPTARHGPPGVLSQLRRRSQINLHLDPQD